MKMLNGRVALLRFFVNFGKKLSFTGYDHLFSEQFKACPTVHLLLNCFEPIDLPLNWPITPIGLKSLIYSLIVRNVARIRIPLANLLMCSASSSIIFFHQCTSFSPVLSFINRLKFSTAFLTFLIIGLSLISLAKYSLGSSSDQSLRKVPNQILSCFEE